MRETPRRSFRDSVEKCAKGARWRRRRRPNESDTYDVESDGIRLSYQDLHIISRICHFYLNSPTMYAVYPLCLREILNEKGAETARWNIETENLARNAECGSIVALETVIKPSWELRNCLRVWISILGWHILIQNIGNIVAMYSFYIRHKFILSNEKYIKAKKYCGRNGFSKKKNIQLTLFKNSRQINARFYAEHERRKIGVDAWKCEARWGATRGGPATSPIPRKVCRAAVPEKNGAAVCTRYPLSLRRSSDTPAGG